MKRFSRKLRRQGTTIKRSHGPSLRMEPLEERRMMDASHVVFDEFVQATAAIVQVNSDPVQLFDDGTLGIYGTDYADDVKVVASDTKVFVVFNGDTYSFDKDVSTGYDNSGIGRLLITPSFITGKVPATRIEFYGGNGDDRLQNDTDLPVTADGGKGDDFLIGGSAADRLIGGDGNDSLLGREEDDVIMGGAGVDRIQGNEGKDRLWGGADNDQIFGGPDDDRLMGEAGNDDLYGEGGVDKLWGGDGHDDLRGGPGFDDLVGGAGVDWFEPGTDNVWIDDPETGYVPYDGLTRIVTLDDNISRTNLVPYNNMTEPTAFLDLNNQWYQNLDKTRDRIIDRLNNARPAGQSLYDISLTLPNQGYQEIAQDDWGTHLRLTVPGAYLEATSTQPTVLGSWADPRFGVSFDITIDIDLAPSGGLRVTGSSATLSNASIQSANVVGDVLDFFNTLSSFFVGIDFKALGESAINSAEFENPIDTTALNLVNLLAPQASVVYDTSSGVVLLRVARQSPPIDIESFAFTPGILSSESLDRVYVSDASSNGVIGGVDRLRLDAGYTSNLADQFDDDRFIESNDSPIPHIDPGMLTTASGMEDLDWAMLNPQPLPPREFELTDAVFAADFDDAMLNPQPLPPREFELTDAVFATDFDDAMLNPQPLPPREFDFNGSLADNFEDVILNPQPLPPREFELTEAVFTADFDDAMLNPQPLPPREFDLNGSLADDFEDVMLNPQPLPPRDFEVADSVFAADFDDVMLNPQPLPPKDFSTGAIAVDPDWVTLNPQPLPPKEWLLSAAGFASQIDTVALNPQPLPPKYSTTPVTASVSYSTVFTSRYRAW